MEIISSNSNKNIKEINKLNKDSAYRRERDVFVVEGIRMFTELPIDRIESVYFSESAFARCGEELGYTGDEPSVYVLKDNIFHSISQTKTPQGLLAVVKCYHYELADILDQKGEAGMYLLVESLQDPGNLGTIMRTSEAAGVTCLIIGGASCDPYNPKVVRSTMGAIFRLPFVYNVDLLEAAELLKEKGVVIYGAHLAGQNIYDEDFTGGTAFLIGNEGNGLSKELSSKADKLIKIPMCGKVESLNAATSAALVSYECMRQRMK